MRRRFVIEIEDGDEGPQASYDLASQVLALLDTAGWEPGECFREEPACTPRNDPPRPAPRTCDECGQPLADNAIGVGGELFCSARCAYPSRPKETP